MASMSEWHVEAWLWFDVVMGATGGIAYGEHDCESLNTVTELTKRVDEKHSQVSATSNRESHLH